jgi:hypothetical protein
MAEPATNIIGFAVYITDGTKWVILLDGDRPFGSVEDAALALTAAEQAAAPVEGSESSGGLRTFIAPLTAPMVEPVSESQRSALYLAVYDGVSPNWEMGSDGYNSAIDAVIAADWRPPVVVTA